MHSFASDNYAGVHPEVLAAIAEVNVGHQPAYGYDPVTAAAEQLFRVHFGPDAEAYFVGNGTAANVLSLQAMLRPYQAVICAESAHINTDECGAPERYLGCKLIDIPVPDGKLTVDLLDARVTGRADEHQVQPAVVSLTQSTEVGTRYSLAETRAIADWVHARGMALHADGARLANAAAGLGVGLGEATAGCGVDLLSFGGTKNGLMGGEAVVFLRPGLGAHFRYYRKQAMQLTAKMRYVAAQFRALLSDDLWRRNAEHANRLARRLAAGVAGVDGVRVTQPVEANAVFAVIPPEAVPVLQEAAAFYVWDERTSEVRWMTSFDTTEEDVDRFVRALRETIGAPNAVRPQ
jgi:threonine aldolase